MKKHNYINDRNVDDDDEEMNQPFEQELSENSYIIILQKELKDLIQQNEKLKVKRHTLSAQQILQMNFINETKYDFWCPIKLPKIRDGNPKVKFFGNEESCHNFGRKWSRRVVEFFPEWRSLGEHSKTCYWCNIQPCSDG
ncbi:unnamed protein product [Brassica oleracea]